MLVHRRVTPRIKFAGTHLYTQEHNAMSQTRVRTRTARSEVERTNHEVSAPPIFSFLILIITVVFLLRKLIWYLKLFRSKLNLKPRSEQSQREWVRPGDGKLVQTKLTSPAFKLKTLTFLAKLRALSYSTYTSLTTSYRNHSSWRLYQVYCT